DAAHDYTVPPDGDVQGGARLVATYTSLTKLTVESSLANVTATVDGASCATPCDVMRPAGARVKVNAPASVALGANSRADFDGWPGGAIDFVVTVGADDQKVRANYHVMNRLIASTDQPNGAVFNVAPISGDGFYDVNTAVSVSLAAQPGYKFRRWDGDLSGT